MKRVSHSPAVHCGLTATRRDESQVVVGAITWRLIHHNSTISSRCCRIGSFSVRDSHLVDLYLLCRISHILADSNIDNHQAGITSWQVTIGQRKLVGSLPVGSTPGGTLGLIGRHLHFLAA